MSWPDRFDPLRSAMNKPCPFFYVCHLGVCKQGETICVVLLLLVGHLPIQSVCCKGVGAGHDDLFHHCMYWPLESEMLPCTVGLQHARHWHFVCIVQSLFSYDLISSADHGKTHRGGEGS